MRGHPLQRGELIRAQPQDVLQIWCDAGPATGNQWSELRVQRGPLSQDAGGQLVRQPAIGLGQRSDLPIERNFKRLSVSNLTEDGQGRAARLETGRQGDRVLLQHSGHGARRHGCLAARHAAGQVGRATGFDRQTHGPRHDDRIAGFGQYPSPERPHDHVFRNQSVGRRCNAAASGPRFVTVSRIRMQSGESFAYSTCTSK